MEFESYTIGAEGKIQINEARGDYFFDPNVTVLGHFLHLPSDRLVLSNVLSPHQ